MKDVSCGCTKGCCVTGCCCGTSACKCGCAMRAKHEGRGKLPGPLVFGYTAATACAPRSWQPEVGPPAEVAAFRAVSPPPTIEVVSHSPSTSHDRLARATS